MVEYLQQPGNIEKAKAFMTANNYVLYYGPRGLFEIQDPNAPPKAPPAGSVSRSEPKPGPVKKIYRAVRNKG